MSKVAIKAINSELKFKTHGITIKVDEPGEQKHSGRLTIGKAKILWTPSGKGIRIGGPQTTEKTWEELIDFFTS
jgi:hypothetical protein